MTISLSRGLVPSVILVVVMAPEIDVVFKVGNQMLELSFLVGDIAKQNVPSRLQTFR